MKNKSVKTMVASVLAVGLMMGIPASAFAVSPGGMSVPSAQSVDSSENCAQILDWLGIQIPRHFDSQAPYKINTLSESDPNYWQAEWETQVYNYKMVRNYPTLYTQDAWDAAQSAGTVMMGLHPESLTDANKQQILEARDAIAALADHQLKPYSDGINGEVIYLWGDDMPVTTLAEDLQFPLVNYEGESVYDNADFQPFLIPYYASGKGATPEYALNYLLTQNGIDPEKDVTIEWKTEHAECLTALMNDPGSAAMLPQPFVTTAQTKNENVNVVVDMNQAWAELNNGSALITGVVIARSEFAEQYPGAVDGFLDGYGESVKYVNANVSAAAELIGKYDIVPAAVAEKALPKCNIVFITGGEMKEKLSGYLGVLFDSAPAAVGGALPGDDFYYGA